jgi:hypothetical protein
LEVEFNSKDSIEGRKRLNIEFDVCDTAKICTEDDYIGPQKCKFSSNRLLIAGRIEFIHEAIYENLEEGTHITGLDIGVTPIGIRY